MRLADYLRPSRCAVLHPRDKEEALSLLFGLLGSCPHIADHDAFVRAIRARESILPTGVGLGIGVPHVRSPVVRDPVAALAVCPGGVAYNSLDHEPVRFLLLVGMPENTHEQYLRYLASATGQFRDPAVRSALLACRDGGEVWEVVREL